jgi:trimeric autotransporter adhesin
MNQIEQKADRAIEGVAISLAVADPILRGNEVFGMRVNWGQYSGQQALGASVMGVLDQNVFGNGEKLAISGGFGVGLENHHVGGRVGLQLTW